MADLGKQYRDTMRPALAKELGIENIYAVPKLEKIVLNIGAGSAIKDKQRFALMMQTLTAISGQKPVATKSKKSISNFKIRGGMDVGMKVTLRGKKMYDFFEKLVRVTFPRVRDFKGVNAKIFDGQGNATIGFSEHIAFPETAGDSVDALHGLQVIIQTSAKNNEQGQKLLEAMGFPFIKKGDA